MSPTHLEFFPDYLRSFVPKAKNDVYREGNYVYIQRLNNQYCPVTNLERYIKLGEIETSSRDYNLFRQVRFFKSDFLRVSRIGRHSRKIDFSFISPKHTFG